MNNNFTQIPNKIIKDKTISDAAFRTYAVLKSYKYLPCSKVFPSQETIAGIRGKTPRRIVDHIKELKDKRYIVSKKRGFSSSNEYDFIREENFTNDKQVSEDSDTSIVKKTSFESRQKLHSNNTKTNNTKLNNDNDSEFKSAKKGLKKILDENPFLRIKRDRLIREKSIK
jgi:molecular chaperone DnaK (HSP70)